MLKGCLEAGAEFDWHSHDKIDEFFLVTKGSGLVEFKNDESWEYTEGDLIYIPSNIEHRIIASDKADNEFFFIRLQGEEYPPSCSVLPSIIKNIKIMNHQLAKQIEDLVYIPSKTLSERMKL